MPGQHKTINKLSWISPDGRSSNQIDHIAINQKWRRSLRDVKAIRGADASSDHHLMLGKLLLKLRSTRGRNSEPLYDSGKNQFVLELNNRFQVLEDLPADINALCDTVLETFLHTSEEILGHKRRERKEWISNTTWRLIEARRTEKHRMLNGTEDQKAAAVEAYRERNREVKRSSRRDKREYTNSLAAEAQSAAERGDTRTVYKITKTLTGGFTSKTTVVKDKDGKVLTKEQDQLDRWA